jgi:hypothetical protein
MPLLVTALATVAPGYLIGQTVAPPVQLDSRVRVTMRVPRGHEFVGRIDGWDERSLNLSVGDYQAQTFPLSDLAKLEISRGMKGNAGTGALIGAGIGLVAGVIGATQVDAEKDAYGLARFAIVFYSILGGTALGAVTGVFIRTEHWEDVTLPEAGAAGHDSQAVR